MSTEQHHSPLDQFKVHPIFEFKIGGLDLSFTNASLFMILAVAAIFALMHFGTRKKAMVPGRLQSVAEMSYEFISGMLHENVGKEGKKYVPFIFSLFMFVLFCNLLGMLPFSFTVTSHIIVTFALAAMVFLSVVIIGFARHGLHFFSLFLPQGVPVILAPLLVVIEMISFLARPLTLSVRLAGNMIAGHVLLKVIASFVVMMGIAGILPLAFLVLLIGFEIFIAALQAYIFSILASVYLNDAVHLH